MFCRCFNRVFLSRLRVCRDEEERAEFILAPQAAVTAEAAVVAAAAERFRFSRRRLNKSELEAPGKARPLVAVAILSFETLDTDVDMVWTRLFPFFASTREAAERPTPSPAA